MPWFVLELSQEDLAKKKGLRLTQEFRAVLNETEANRCLAIFQEKSQPHNYYISCDKVCQLLYALIQFYQGDQCEKPNKEDLFYLDGHYDDHLAENVK